MWSLQTHGIFKLLITFKLSFIIDSQEIEIPRTYFKITDIYNIWNPAGQNISLLQIWLDRNV